TAPSRSLTVAANEGVASVAIASRSKGAFMRRYLAGCTGFCKCFVSRRGVPKATTVGLARCRILRSICASSNGAEPSARQVCPGREMLTMKNVRTCGWIGWLAVLCLIGGQQGLFAAGKAPSGKDIFRQMCVKCHGRNGEGVKGKYDDALVGDWSIEKLTRYIDKNMPDDHPGKCTGRDADAVARFIYDTFYSREARARNHPPRVE